MTGRDPDEPEPRTDVDEAFAQIVAGWDGRPDWPAEDDTEELADLPVAVEAEDDLDDAEAIDDDDHFVPPEPPPLPRPQPQTIGAIVLFALGLVLLVIPSVLGFSAQAGLILGLLAISGGIVWLIARLRQGPPTDSGWDDGAQI